MEVLTAVLITYHVFACAAFAELGLNGVIRAYVLPSS